MFVSQELVHVRLDRVLELQRKWLTETKWLLQDTTETVNVQMFIIKLEDLLGTCKTLRMLIIISEESFTIIFEFVKIHLYIVDTVLHLYCP